MIKLSLLRTLFCILFTLSTFDLSLAWGQQIASERVGPSSLESPSDSPATVLSTMHIEYGYPERSHTFGESASIVAALYPIGWLGYYLTQKSTFENKGSWKNYRRNFGEIVFDKDGPIWNWVVHPISGSQMYLLFRAYGYSRWDSFFLTTIEEALFEFTTEIYTEPASIQDLYQTPVLGSILGMAIETASMALLNSGSGALRVFGHIINPTTLFWFYEGEVISTPIIGAKGMPQGMEVSIVF